MRQILVCGYWDNSYKCFGVDGRHTQSVFGHSDTVTCICASAEERHVAAGCRDGLIRVWALNVRGAATSTAIGAPLIREPSSALLAGHAHPVECVAVSSGQDLVVSGAANICLLHTLAGQLLHVIQPPGLR